MVKFGIVSDIHSEFWQTPDLKKVGGMIQQNLKDADIILLAGDIGSGPQAIRLANHLWPDKSICQVAGNHEYYNHVTDDTIHTMTQAAASFSNHYFLNRDVYINTDFEKPVRVIGATLWTDFNLYGTQHLSMLHGQKNIMDFHCIFKNIQNDLLKPADVLKWHEKDKEFIQSEMDKPFDGITIVLTHHCPVSFGDHPRFAGGPNSPCFLSNLDSMFTRDDLDLVVWGHTHWSVDKTFTKTRFVSNQVGYLNNPYSFFQGAAGQLTETGDFGIVVEI